MNMTIHCLRCEAQLTVPDDAGGRAARCPRCRNKFRVPGFDTLLDETVAAWLFTPEEEEPQDESDKEGKEKPAATPTSPSGSTAAAAAAPEKLAASTRPPTDSPSRPPRERTPAPQQCDPLPAGEEGPVQLQVDAVSAAGVSIRFPSRYLLLPPFRASLPMECVQCEHDEPTHLLARPLAFYDRSRGSYESSGEIESRFETQINPEQSHEEVVAAMTVMTELASPFDHPTPYFVCGRCASKVTLTCRTVPGNQGPECRVQVPSGAYALSWLGRVNGICGQDFTELSQCIHGEAPEAWQSIPPQVRQRLSNWCAFEPRESFVTYLPDSDFTTRDAGLAGIVLTTLRVIFCKHHTRGSLPLDATGELTLRQRGQFYDLNHRDGERIRRLGCLRRKHGVELTETLDKLGSPLRIVHAVAS